MREQLATALLFLALFLLSSVALVLVSLPLWSAP